MSFRSLVFLALAAPLFLAGCRDAKITTYRVPRENPPDLASAQSSPGADMTAANASASGLPAAPTDSPLAWTAPADWTPQPLGAMRKGSFLVKDPDGSTADVSIIAFPGAAGGLADNVNRWRGQLKLPALAGAELDAACATLEAGALKFTVVDFSGQGENGPARILGAILPLGDETYFFKLMGPAALAEKSRPAFLAFLKTVKTR